MRPWRVKMPTQNLLRLLLFLMLVMRIVLATVCCRFGSPGLVITLNFCSDFEHFCQDFEVEVRRDFEAEVWSVFCCWCLVEVTKLNPGQYSEARFGQVILWYELNPRVRCAFGNVFYSGWCETVCGEQEKRGNLGEEWEVRLYFIVSCNVIFMYLVYIAGVLITSIGMIYGKSRHWHDIEMSSLWK